MTDQTNTHDGEGVKACPVRESFHLPCDYIRAARKHMRLTKEQMAVRLQFAEDDYDALEFGFRHPRERVFKLVEQMLLAKGTGR